MFGFVHNVLFSLIRRLGGEPALEEVLRRAEVPHGRQFRLDTSYADEEWRRLFQAACSVLDVSPDQAEEAFAEEFIRDAPVRFPAWFRMAKNSRDFLLRQPHIHRSFAAASEDEGFRKSVEDKFLVELEGDTLIVHYNSPNHHCDLYRALAGRIVRHYGDEAIIESVRCVKRGDPECEIRVQWTKIESLTR